MKKVWAIAIFSAIVAISLCFAFISSATGEGPVMYRNDTKYTIDQFPAETVNGKVYLPVSFFVGMKNVQYEYGANQSGFYMRNAVSGRFFSFSYNVDYILLDGEITEISFPILNSTVYMPLDLCAEVLSLKIERRSSDGIERIRVSDITAQLSFEDLIKLYDPEETPEKPPVIEPGDPSENPSVIQPNARTLYIAISPCEGESSSDIMAVLNERNTKATFFFTKESIENDPETVIDVFIHGHAIGVTGETAEAAESANEALSSLLNFKTRLCMPMFEGAEALERKGYKTVNYDIDSDLINKSARESARDIYNKTFEKTFTTVKLSCTEKSADTVERILYYTSGDAYITAETLE